MSGLCAVTLGGLLLLGPGDTFLLSWTHSVEKLEWREAWRVDSGQLVLEKASVQGSGAGMEPPPEADYAAGWWTWHPGTRHGAVRPALSPHAGDWSLCIGGACRPLRNLLEGADQVTLVACP